MLLRLWIVTKQFSESILSINSLNMFEYYFKLSSLTNCLLLYKETPLWIQHCSSFRGSLLTSSCLCYYGVGNYLWLFKSVITPRLFHSDIQLFYENLSILLFAHDNLCLSLSDIQSNVKLGEYIIPTTY